MPDTFWRYMPSDKYDQLKASQEAAKPPKPLLPRLVLPTPPTAKQPAWLTPRTQTVPETSATVPDMSTPTQSVPLPTWAMTQQPPQQQVVAPPTQFAQAAPVQNLQRSSSPLWVTRSALPTAQPIVGQPDQTLAPTTSLPMQPVAQPIAPPVTPLPWFQRGRQEDPNAWKAAPSQGIAPYDKSQGLLPNVGRMIGEGVKTLGSGVSQLTDPILSLIDRFRNGGQLSQEDASAFETAYNSLDRSIDPNIRASMAREVLPGSVKQSILKVVDWTTQNLDKQLVGEYVSAWKGTFSGGEVPTYDEQGVQTGTKKANIGKYLLDNTLRALTGGGLFAAYGSGVDAEIMKRVALGQTSTALKDIMQNRQDWKNIENKMGEGGMFTPGGFAQFVGEMVVDPINLASWGMGTAAGQIEKSAAKAGSTAMAQNLAESAARGAVMGAGTEAAINASMAAARATGTYKAVAFSRGIKTVKSITNTLDTLQNYGYLVSLPGDSAVNMFMMMQGMSKIMPIATNILLGLGVKGAKAIGLIKKPVIPTMDELAEALGTAHYDVATEAAGGKLPSRSTYVTKAADGSAEMFINNTRDNYIRNTRDALAAPLNIQDRKGGDYATMYDMIADYIKKDVSTPGDFMGATGDAAQRARDQVSPAPEGAPEGGTGPRVASAPIAIGDKVTYQGRPGEVVDAETLPDDRRMLHVFFSDNGETLKRVDTAVQKAEAPVEAAPTLPLAQQLTGEQPRLAEAAPVPQEQPVPTVAKEPWEMTSREFRTSQNQSLLDAAKAKISGSTPFVLSTAYRKTTITDPNLMRLGSDGLFQIPEGKKWVSIPDEGQIRRFVGAETDLSKIPTHVGEVQKALSEGRPVPASVLADYPDLAKAQPAVAPLNAEQPAGTVAQPVTTAAAAAAPAKAEVAAPVEAAAKPPEAAAPVKLSNGTEIPTDEYNGLFKPAEGVVYGSAKSVSTPSFDKTYDNARVALFPHDLVKDSTSPQYPPTIGSQARDLTTAPSLAAISKIANTFKARQFFEDASTLDRGLKTLSPSLVVLQGNNRNAALDLILTGMNNASPEVRAQWTAKYNDYLTELRTAATNRGIDAGEVDKIIASGKIPDMGIIVDENTTVGGAKMSADDLVAIGTSGNENASRQMSPREQAVNDSRRINMSDVEMLTLPQTDNYDMGDVLRNSPEFDGSLQRAIGNTEYLGLHNSDGSWTREGIARVKNVLLVKVYGDKHGSQMIERMSADDMMRQVERALTDSLPSLSWIRGRTTGANVTVDASFDIAPKIGEALRLFMDYRESPVETRPKTISDYLGLGEQTSLVKVTDDDFVSKLTQMINGMVYGNSTKLSRFLVEYGNTVRDMPPKNQAGFGFEGQKTPISILNDLLIKYGVEANTTVKLPDSLQKAASDLVAQTEGAFQEPTAPLKPVAEVPKLDPNKPIVSEVDDTINMHIPVFSDGVVQAGDLAFTTKLAEWNGMDAKAKEALVRKSINGSLRLRRLKGEPKARMIADITAQADEWATRQNGVRVAVQIEGKVPDSLVGEPQPEAGGAGNQPPNVPPSQPGTPQQPVAQPAPQQPLPGIPGTRQGGNAATTPTGGRGTPANAGAQMALQPATRKLFMVQSKAAAVVADIRKLYGKGGDTLNTRKARRAVAVALRSVFPEAGAREIDSLVGIVYGKTLDEATQITGSANDYFTIAMNKMQDTGVVFGKDDAASGWGLRADADQPLTLNGRDTATWVLADGSGRTAKQVLGQMKSRLSDLLSFPTWFEPKDAAGNRLMDTNPDLAQRRIDALQETVDLTRRMYGELETEMQSRGITVEQLKVDAENYIPRPIKTKNDITPLGNFDDETGRAHLTATDGAAAGMAYRDTTSAILNHVRSLAAHIGNLETVQAMRDFGARTAGEIADAQNPQLRTELTAQQNGLAKAQAAKDTLTDFATTTQSPVAAPPEFVFMDGELPGSNFSQRAMAMGSETDYQVKQAAFATLKQEAAMVFKSYEQGASAANRVLDKAIGDVGGLGQTTARGLGMAGDPDAIIPVSQIGLKTPNKRAGKAEKVSSFTPIDDAPLYMERTNADRVTDWFGKESSATINTFSTFNAVSRMLTLSTDLDFATRLAFVAIKHPRIYAKAMVMSFLSPDKMAAWLGSDEISKIVIDIEEHGGNIDNAADIVEAFNDSPQIGPVSAFMKSSAGKRLAGLAANPANVAQILMYRANVDGVKERGRGDARAKGVTSAEGIKAAEDWRVSEYVRATQDYLGLSSLLARGHSKLARTTGRFVFLSSRRTLGAINMQLNLFKGGERGRQTRTMLLTEAIAVTAAAASVHVINGLIQGQDIESDEFWRPWYTPGDPGFFKTNIGGIRVGPGGMPINIFNFWANVEKTAREYPDELTKGIDANHPLLQWARGRLGPAPGALLTALTGKNFAGQRIDTPLKWVGEVGGLALPMSLQTIAKKGINAPTLIGTAFSWVGGKSTPDTPSMLQKKARETAAQAEYGKPWAELDLADKALMAEEYPELKELANEVLLNRAAKDDPMAMFQMDVDNEYELIDAKASEYEVMFKNGQRSNGSRYTATDYRDDIRALDAEKSQVKGVIKRANPAYKNVPVTSEERDAYYAKFQKATQSPVDAFIDAWYRTAEEATIDPNSATGDIDFEKYFAAREALVAKTSPAIVAKAKGYIDRNKDPLLVQANMAYQRYRNLPMYRGLDAMQSKAVQDFTNAATAYKYSSGLPAYADAKQVRIALYKSDPTKWQAAFDLYRKYGTRTSKEREAFKYLNGDKRQGWSQDWLLIKAFYGGLTLDETQTAMAGAAV